MPRPKRENKEDSRLVEQAQRDKEAFGDLYHKYFGKVQGYLAKRLGGSHEVAEDLAQETFLRAFTALSRFRSRGYSYLTYLFRISRNLLVDFYRKTKEARLPSDILAFLGKEHIEKEIDRKLLYEHLARAIGKLPKNNQKVLRAYYEEGLSIKDIGKKLGKSENAVKLLLARSRKRLGSILEKETPFLNPDVSNIRKGERSKKKR
ncbi:MAG: hypothetical protein A2672_02860 [Candidatus Wildermuthbacteria bacterium RIFCSPHIGHO2_01_FULL_49_22b]|uniref:RNA polymerase sigma factor n=1 Tax=Candidatus Wildermuthbacteria bacterium RIFCSPHIGHO2_01_FULL_49_22b TaxID=1802448 RepID=A0A1G2QVH3_9BACT|nr:MAG: hypothetical protein A2672_02860 [Candidatus Wildermuthbacteria bacterium RIFCSPHIGHO2_01_FULL_49_22b]